MKKVWIVIEVSGHCNAANFNRVIGEYDNPEKAEAVASAFNEERQWGEPCPHCGRPEGLQWSRAELVAVEDGSDEYWDIIEGRALWAY